MFLAHLGRNCPISRDIASIQKQCVLVVRLLWPPLLKSRLLLRLIKPLLQPPFDPQVTSATVSRADGFLNKHTHKHTSRRHCSISTASAAPAREHSWGPDCRLSLLLHAPAGTSSAICRYHFSSNKVMIARKSLLKQLAPVV